MTARDDIFFISEGDIVIWKENGFFYYEPRYLYSIDPERSAATQMPYFDINTEIKAGRSSESMALMWCRLWGEPPPYLIVLHIVRAYIQYLKDNRGYTLV